MKEKFLPEGVVQACFTTISLTYHLFWGKKEKKENKYKVEKHHICTTQWHQYTPSLILLKKKKTHTKQYYLKTVQLNKEKSNSNLKNTKKLPES